MHVSYISHVMDTEVCLSEEEGEFSESCLHSQVRPRHHTKLTQLLVQETGMR